MDLPEWATWSWREEFLPATFHTVTGFREAQALLHQQPKTPEDADCILLGIGLALRDIGRAQEVEADAQACPLGFKPQSWISRWWMASSNVSLWPM